MARCSYLYPDDARCVYEDRGLDEGEMCKEHAHLTRDKAVRARANVKNAARRKAKRAEARQGVDRG